MVAAETDMLPSETALNFPRVQLVHITHLRQCFQYNLSIEYICTDMDV